MLEGDFLLMVVQFFCQRNLTMFFIKCTLQYTCKIYFYHLNNVPLSCGFSSTHPLPQSLQGAIEMSREIFSMDKVLHFRRITSEFAKISLAKAVVHTEQRAWSEIVKQCICSDRAAV